MQLLVLSVDLTYAQLKSTRGGDSQQPSVEQILLDQSPLFLRISPAIARDEGEETLALLAFD